MWIYEGNQINNLSDIEKHYGKIPFGFIYNITLFHGGQSYEYIGKKNLFTVRSKVASQKQVEKLGKSSFRRKKQKKGKKTGEWVYYEVVKKESMWSDYLSSSKEVKKMIKNGAEFTKYILEFVEEENMMHYRECKNQFCSSVLEENRFLNDNIAGRWYKKNVLKG